MIGLIFKCRRRVVKCISNSKGYVGEFKWIAREKQKTGKKRERDEKGRGVDKTLE